MTTIDTTATGRNPYEIQVNTKGMNRDSLNVSMEKES